jgi:predicted lysophospholipase L1 biosynthesis ABC-type transport system permease subunit
VSPKKRAGRPGQRPARPRKATPARPSSARNGQRAPAEPSFYTPGSSSLRRSVERTSAPALVLLTHMPRLVVMLAPLALLLLGFFLPLAIGLVFLAIFFLFTGWLAYLSWPRTDAKARLLRFAIFALVIALAAIKIARA